MASFRISADSEPGAVSVTWQKSFKEENKIQRSGAGDVLALSAFMLSSLPSPVARKALVKEIWDSGADTMVMSILLQLYIQSSMIDLTGIN